MKNIVQRVKYFVFLRQDLLRQKQYFGISHKYHGAGKARFTPIVKEHWDHLCGAMAFNIKRVILNLRKRQMVAAI